MRKRSNYAVGSSIVAVRTVGSDSSEITSNDDSVSLGNGSENDLVSIDYGID